MRSPKSAGAAAPLRGSSCRRRRRVRCQRNPRRRAGRPGRRLHPVPEGAEAPPPSLSRAGAQPCRAQAGGDAVLPRGRIGAGNRARPRRAAGHRLDADHRHARRPARARAARRRGSPSSARPSACSPIAFLARGADILGSVRITAPDQFLDLLAEGGSAPHFLGHCAEKIVLARRSVAAAAKVA